MTKNARVFLRWFVAGMGSVMGISHSMPPLRNNMIGPEAAQSDIAAVGNDFRSVLKRYPATAETGKTLAVQS